MGASGHTTGTGSTKEAGESDMMLFGCLLQLEALGVAVASVQGEAGIRQILHPRDGGPTSLV